jgi:uncharacterized membrane protein
MMDHMMDGVMGLGWLWMVLGTVLLVALIVLVLMLIVRTSRGLAPKFAAAREELVRA